MLISVTDLNGETEALNNYQRLTLNEEINGVFSISITSFYNENNPCHSLLKEESIVHIKGYDFRVKQIKEYDNVKECTAISTFYDLVNKRQSTIYGGTRTFDQFAAHVFQGTGWIFINKDVTISAFIPNFGVDNVIKLNQIMCDAFECEFEILPNKQVAFANQIGGDHDAQYRYGHNIQALSKSVDTTNMRTRITGYGGNGLEVTYTSPNAETYGIMDAEPFEDAKLSTEASLLIRAKQELQDYPLTTIELKSLELVDKELGERVWLIYEPLNIEYQTRIMSKKTVVRNGKLVTESVTIGNTIPRIITDILTSQRVDIDTNNKETQSRFEQTNERITLGVERIDDSIAAIIIDADDIKLSVAAVENSVAAISIRADQITVSVATLGDRIGSAESALTFQAGVISSKVSMTDITGELIWSKIDQTPTTVKIKADNIELSGITEVANTLHIGGHYTDTGKKYLKFNGETGYAGMIFTPSGDGLEVHAINVVKLTSTDIVMNGHVVFSGTVDWGNNKPVAVWG